MVCTEEILTLDSLPGMATVLFLKGPTEVTQPGQGTLRGGACLSSFNRTCTGKCPCHCGAMAEA